MVGIRDVKFMVLCDILVLSRSKFCRNLIVTEHAMGTSMKKRQRKKQNPTEIKANKNTPGGHAKVALN